MEYVLLKCTLRDVCPECFGELHQALMITEPEHGPDVWHVYRDSVCCRCRYRKIEQTTGRPDYAVLGLHLPKGIVI